MSQAPTPERTFRLGTATWLVIASMIGTGVFTTLGYQVADLGSAPAALFAWLLGGVTALGGALAYAELTAALPTNGGEYALLARIYHPLVGFVAGFVSLVVGFAAPVAAGAIAFGKYLHAAFPQLPESVTVVAGVLLIVQASALHIFTVRRGTLFQDFVTGAKVLLLGTFLLGGVLLGDFGRIVSSQNQRGMVDAVLLPEFAVGLVFVAFAYTGWNAAAYVAGEVEDAPRNLPRALVLGTAIVTLIYLALNAVFLASAPMDALAGQVEVGAVAAEALFAPIFGSLAPRLLDLLVAIGLISTVGAMTLTGPRIYEAMGRDFPRLRPLAQRRAGGGPVGATLLQSGLAILMALSASFDALLLYTGITLSLVAGLTAAGVFVLRAREPDLPRPYRTWGHPITTLVFLALNAWMVLYSVGEEPVVALVSAGTLATAALVGRWATRGR